MALPTIENYGLQRRELDGFDGFDQIIPADISKSEYDVKIPLNDNYSTLRGFLLDMLGNNFPKQGNILFWEGLSFELLEVIDNEIEEVKIESTDGERHITKPKEAEELVSPEEPDAVLN